MLFFFFHLSFEDSLCSSVTHFRFYGSLIVDQNHKENDYCGLWEGGERFFILSPLRRNGTIINIYSSTRSLTDDLIPDLMFQSDKEPYIAKFTKSVVSIFAHVPLNQSLYITGVNIPLFSCIKGVVFSTKRNGTWNSSKSGQCMLIAPGFKFDIRLKEPLKDRNSMKVHSGVFSLPNATLQKNTQWISFSQPVVFESQGKGEIQWKSEGYGDGQIEVEGNAANQLFTVTVICAVVVVLFSFLMIAGAIYCYCDWLKTENDKFEYVY